MRNFYDDTFRNTIISGTIYRFKVKFGAIRIISASFPNTSTSRNFCPVTWLQSARLNNYRLILRVVKTG